MEVLFLGVIFTVLQMNYFDPMLTFNVVNVEA